MDHNDRFFRIVCWSAGLITAAAFVAASVDFSRAPEPRITSSRPVPAAEPTTAPVESIEVEPVPAFRADAPAEADQAAAGVALAVNTEPAPPSWGASRDIRRLVAAIDAVADGKPARLELLELPSPADVLVRYDSDGRLVVANGTHRRYRDMIEALAAVDLEALAAAFTEVEPAMQVAFRDISVDGGDVQIRLAEAIDQLTDLELPAVEPAMRSRGRHWGFADEELEALGPLQKHLLLMGRDNALEVQSFLRRLRAALALPGPPVEHGLTIADLQPPAATDDPGIVATQSAASSAETAAPDPASPTGDTGSSQAGPVAAP